MILFELPKDAIVEKYYLECEDFSQHIWNVIVVYKLTRLPNLRTRPIRRYKGIMKAARALYYLEFQLRYPSHEQLSLFELSDP